MKRTAPILIIAMLLLTFTAAPASASILDDLNGQIGSTLSKITQAAKSLTITSYSSSVPVQIGYDKPSSFWIITGTLGWQKDSLLLVKLPAGTTDTIAGSTDTAKAQADVSIQFDPKGSYEKAPMTRQDLVYRNSAWDTYCTSYGCGGGSSAAYKVETGSWQTTTIYDVSVNNNWQTVEVGMSSPTDVNLGQGIFIKNLGILPNGANFPGGNWMYVFNPVSQNYELYSTIDVQNAVAYWNVNYPVWTSYADGTWLGVWRFLSDKGKLPTKPVMTATAINAIVENGDYKYIKLTYPRVAQSSYISLYVPSSIASTIIIQIGGSKGQIVGTPTITQVKDGTDAQLTVFVKNTGGDDYLTVKPTSAYWAFTAIGDSTKFLKSGENTYFTFSARALDVTGDKSGLPINILVDGTDPYTGDASTTIYGSILDSNVITTQYKLTVRALRPDGSILSDAPIIVNNNNEGKGQITISNAKGDYVLSSQNTTSLYTPSPKTVTVTNQDMTADLQFSTIPKPQEPQPNTIDLTWIFWGALALIIGYVAYKQGILQTLAKNPLMIMVLVISIYILWLLWQIIQAISGIADSAESTANAVNNMLPWNWF